MTGAKLLRELEPLTHAARVRRMVELGRAASADARVATTLVALREGGFYERWLALLSCQGSRDGNHLLQALGDASRTIRGLAIRLIPLVCDDAHVRAALETATERQRRALLLRLARRRRTAPIDDFLAAQAGQDTSRFSALLPFGSAAMVEQHLETVADRADAADWRRLARWHPPLAAEALRRRAAAADAQDPRLIWHANAALPELAERAPVAALALVDELVRHAAPARLALHHLAKRQPAPMAERALRWDDRPEALFTWVADRLDREQILGLIERRLITLADRDRWFGRLAPAQRADLFAASALGWRDVDGCVSPEIVARLSREQRESEARRHLALPALQTRPQQRLRYAAFLPWDEARAFLDPFIRNPDADLRGEALATLALATRYHRDRLPDLLALVRARQFEQDPVRHRMLSALTALPPGSWRAEHVDDLGAVLRDALDAADLSGATVIAAEALVVRLLRFHPAWAAPWLATLVKERGYISSYGLAFDLTDEDVRRIAPHLLPVLKSWATREREGQLVALAESLGRRLRVFDGLAEILERLMRDTRSHWIAERALQMIVRHRPGRRDTIIPALLREDPSWVTRQPVYSYLHAKRQDLLTPFLGQQAYKGRFSTGRTKTVLPFQGGFYRWTPSQQSIYAGALTAMVEDKDRDSVTSLWVIRQLAELPAVPADRLLQWARRDNPRPPLRDVALQSLSRLDAGQGVPTLLEALEDARARVAIYALRRTLLEMPARPTATLLRGVSLEKVTVAKEVVRLLGELRSEEAYRELLAASTQDLHRDVRIALLRAFWDHLERDEPWPLFEAAAASPDAAIATSVARVPADRLSLAAQRRLSALLATLLQHPEPTLRLETLRRCAQLPVTDEAQLLFPPLLAALGSPLPDEYAAAASALFATCAAREPERVGAAVAGMVGRRRTLQTVVQTLLAAVAGNRGQLAPTVRSVLTALQDDPLTVSLQVELALHALPSAEAAALLERLAASDALHPEALLAAVRSVETAGSRREPAFAEHLGQALQAQEDAGLRRVALAALVAQAHDPRGWDEDRLARLRSYRDDPAPLVAAAAQFTFPANE